MKCLADKSIKNCNYVGSCCSDCTYDWDSHNDCHDTCKNYHPYKQDNNGNWIVSGCRDCEYCVE